MNPRLALLLLAAAISTQAVPLVPLSTNEIATPRPRCEFFVVAAASTGGNSAAVGDPMIEAKVTCDEKVVVDVKGALSTMTQREVAKGVTLFPRDGRSYLWVDDARMFDMVDSHFDNLPGAHGGGIMLAPVIVGKTRMGVNGTAFSGNYGFRKAGAIYCTDGCVIDARTSVFYKCKGADAGAAVVDNGSDLELHNVAFAENSGTVYAGAISVHDNSKLDVADCKFTGIEAPKAFQEYVRGEREFLPNDVTVPNAGAISLVEDAFATIKGSQFVNHGGIHGTIFASGDVLVLISTCEFVKNFVTFGGGIFIDGLASRIRGCTFDGNNARMGGGVVTLGSGRHTFYSCSFLMNEASEFGGAIYTDFRRPNATDYTQCKKPTEGSTLLIEETKFISNKAEYSGGGIYSKCTHVTANTTVFDSNEAKLYGGAISMEIGAEFDAKSSTFNANLAGRGGSAVRIVNTTLLDTSNCDFTDNTVHGLGGGAISAVDTQGVKLSNCGVVGNSAMGSGGGVAIERAETIQIIGCRLLKNSGGPQGGAVWVDGVSDQMSIRDAQISENSAQLGGALALDNIEQATLASVKFVSNKANELEGGALAVRDASDFEISDVNFEGNTAGLSCGAVLAERVESIRSEKTTFQLNAAKRGHGGAICMRRVAKWNSDATVVISSNSCKLLGGGMSIQNCEKVTFGGTQFSQNGGESGGAIHAKSVEKITATDLVVTQNEAKDSGGGVMFNGVQILELIGGEIVENSSGGEGGGAVIVGGVALEFTNAQVSGNKAQSSGGGLVLRSCDTVEIDSSDFHNNTSGRSAGAILAQNLDDFHLYATNFSQNSANDNGGAVYIQGGALVNVTTVNLARNTADGSGGGVFCTGDSDVKVTNATFDFNFARAGQSVSVKCTCAVDITSSIFKRDRKRRRNGDFFDREKGCASIQRDLATVFIGAPIKRLSGWWIAFIVLVCVAVVLLCCCVGHRKGWLQRWGFSRADQPIDTNAAPLLPTDSRGDDNLKSHPISFNGGASTEIQAAPQLLPPGPSEIKKKPAPPHQHVDDSDDGDFYCDICGEYVNEDYEDWEYDESYDNDDSDDYYERRRRQYRNGKGPRRF